MISLLITKTCSQYSGIYCIFTNVLLKEFEVKTAKIDLHKKYYLLCSALLYPFALVLATRAYPTYNE